MPTQEKSARIDELKEKLSRATVAILIQTQGLNSKDTSDLRSKMRAANIDLEVVKNTLLRIAAERSDMTGVDSSIFNGQTAVAWSYDDEVAAAKAVSDYITNARNTLALKSGILGGRSLTADEVTNLGKLPGGKQQSKANVFGVIQGPLSNTVGLLNAPLRDLCYVLQAHAEQLNGGPVTE